MVRIVTGQRSHRKQECDEVRLTLQMHLERRVLPNAPKLGSACAFEQASHVDMLSNRTPGPSDTRFGLAYGALSERPYSKRTCRATLPSSDIPRIRSAASRTTKLPTIYRVYWAYGLGNIHSSGDLWPAWGFHLVRSEAARKQQHAVQNAVPMLNAAW